MSELAYRLILQCRALARERLFENEALDVKARSRHSECARRLAARIIAGTYDNCALTTKAAAIFGSSGFSLPCAVARLSQTLMHSLRH